MHKYDFPPRQNVATVYGVVSELHEILQAVHSDPSEISEGLEM